MSRTDFCRGAVVRLFRIGALAAAMGALALALAAGAGPPIDPGRFDHGSWSDLAGGMSGPNLFQVSVRALASFDDGWGDGPVLYAGGYFTSAGGVDAQSLARWDGRAWQSLGEVVFNTSPGLVESMVVWARPNDTPVLVVGGSFTSVDGVPAKSVAMWDGAAWSAMGDGLAFGSNVVTDLSVFDDGTGPAVHAVGSFVASGRTVVGPGVARFDGRAWSSVGPQITGDPLTPRIAFFDPGDGAGTRLVVGGTNLKSNREPLGGLAWLDGRRGWTPLPGVLVGANDGFANDLDSAVWQGRSTLFAAGGLYLDGMSGRVPVVALSDGAWTRPGGGVADREASMVTGISVEVLADGDEPAVYLGGLFDIAGGTPVRGVARWNGAFWLPLAEGISSSAPASTDAQSDALLGGPTAPLAFALDPTADGSQVIVAGRFRYAGATPAIGIAAFTPPLDPRPGPFVHRAALEIEVLDAPGESALRFREDDATGTYVLATKTRLMTDAGEVVLESPLEGAAVQIADANLDGVVSGLLTFGPSSNLGFRFDRGTGQWTIAEGDEGPCKICGANAVAPNGLVVGSTYDAALGGTVAFIADAESVEVIASPPGVSIVRPSDVNDDGLVIGRAFLSGVGYRPFLGLGSALQVLSTPEDASSVRAIRIAPNGLILGNAKFAAVSSELALSWAPDGTTYEFLLPLEPTGGTVAFDVGPGSIVIGTARAGGAVHAVRWIDGTPQPLRPLVPWTDAWRLGSVKAIALTGRLAGEWRFGALEPDGTSGIESRLALFRDCTAPTGDIDGDGQIDAYDLGLVLVEFGRTDSVADLDGDGTVDGADLGAVLAHWTEE